MKVGLVLGGGGVMGGAWLTGGLAALASESGWSPGEADQIVGTSAGSMIGALAASGIPPWFMVAHSAGEVFDGLRDARGQLASDADRSAGAVFRPLRDLPSLGPGSLELALATLIDPWRHPPRSRFGWLATPRQDLDRAAEGDRSPGHPLRVGAASEPLGDGVRLSQRSPGRLRP
jgi:hypothetical protein